MKFVPMKVSEDAHKLIKSIAAYKGKHIVDYMDELALREYEETHKSKKNTEDRRDFRFF